MPEISIKAEPVFSLFGFTVTNSFFTSSIVMVLTMFLCVYYYRQSKAQVKKGLYYAVKFIVNAVYSLFESVFSEKTPLFFPILFAFFFYILLQNWIGLLPGVGSILYKHVPLFRGNNADLNTTVGLALISFFLIQYYSVKYLGVKGYLKKFFNFTNPIIFFVGILDIISEFSKIFSFSFRLFGNIFAGEVLMTIIAFLIPILASFPFLLFEIFVGLIQALVFSMLTAVFINGAIQKQH